MFQTGVGVDPKYTDPQRTLAFGRQKIGQRFFLIGAIALLAGIVFINFGGSERKLIFTGYLCVVLGFALCMYEMHRHFHPGKPVLSLAPDGVRYNIEWVKEIRIPWHEIKALRRINVTDTTRRSLFPATFANVTALVVTSEFYDRAIHVNNLLMRGPGWGNIFIPDERNKVMQMALHHEILPVTADELYAALETRWQAFRDRKPENTAPAPAPA